MPSNVVDNQPNQQICKNSCEKCPTFNQSLLKEYAPHLLFCSRGKSDKKDIGTKGCNCFSCPIFKREKLTGGYFCIYGIQGKK
ncbi:MAG: DUF2769 domain-containing protein [Candidatus Thorarchaeota archaeon]